MIENTFHQTIYTNTAQFWACSEYCKYCKIYFGFEHIHFARLWTCFWLGQVFLSHEHLSSWFHCVWQCWNILVCNVLLFPVFSTKFYFFDNKKYIKNYTCFFTLLEGRGKKNYKNIRKYYRSAWVKRASGKPLDK